MPCVSLSARVIAGALGFCALSAPSGADVIYVDANLATGANDGTSWDNAYRGETALANAIDACSAGDQIWVADGRYIPGSLRASTFRLKSNVGIYGGFAGGETALDQRNPALNVALLSGDVNNDDEAFPSLGGWADNAYHIVTAKAPDANGILDGFTITHGHANGPTTSDDDRGGGILCLYGFPTLRNLLIRENRAERSGGGVYVRNASGWLTDCRIESNIGGLFGGGIEFNSAHPEILRCLIADNTAVRGGGVDISGDAFAEFTNCVLTRNRSTLAEGVLGGGGGGVRVIESSNATFFNCTIYANTANNVGGGVHTTSASTALYNTIIYANTGAGGATQGQQLVGSNYTVSYGCIQHGYNGPGNIAADPMLLDPANNDLRPGLGSPVVDAAKNANLGADVLVDFAGARRFVDDPATPDTGLGKAPVIDMGALEFQFTGSGCPEIVADPVGATLCRGGQITLTVVAKGTGVTGYQWRKDGSDLPGETGDTLVLSDVTDATEGVYTAVMFSEACPAYVSAPALIVVCGTDANCDNVVNSTDVSDFINLYFHAVKFGTLEADFDGNGAVNSTDVSTFITIWFRESARGCAG